MIDMAKCLIEKSRDVGIKEPIDHMAPTPIADHETKIPQYPQLMRDSRLFHLDDCAEFANRTRSVTQPSQNAYPAGGGEGTHESGHLLRRPQGKRALGEGVVGLTHVYKLTCTCIHVKPTGGVHCPAPRNG